MKKGLLLIGILMTAIHVMAQDCSPGTVSEDQTICSGTQPGALTIEDYETGATLQWQFSTDGTNYTDVTGGSGATISPGSLSTTTYYRVLITAATCDDVFSNIITVTVEQPPTAPTGIVANDIVCYGATATLTAAGGSSGSGAMFEWGWGNQVGTNPMDLTGTNSIAVSNLTADTTFWVRRVGNTSCTLETTGVIKEIEVKAKAVISIAGPEELCQLKDQVVTVTNETEGQLPLTINYAYGSVLGQPTTMTLENTADIYLNLTDETDENATFTIIDYEFVDAPKCLNESSIALVFDVKPRPAISAISHNISSVLGNELCQNYGSVEFEVSNPANINWTASYFITDDLIANNITQSPYNAVVDSAAVHSFILDSLWYATGLACGHNPADYTNNLASYSEAITIKPTPPAVEFMPGTPAVIQFCDYTSPLNLDSAAAVTQLNYWVSNPLNYDLKWKLTNDNESGNINNNVPLINGTSYYPIFEDDGCPSKLDETSLSLVVHLLPLPNMSQSNLIVPDQICSGNPFDIWFSPSENITHYGISDFVFQGDLNSNNISNSVDYSNASGSNFVITNSAISVETWNAKVYAKNKNISDVNPVTCWAEPIPIAIQVNPNASFNPTSAHFESCSNGPDFTIDPGWNQVGGATWEEPFNFPAPIQIDAVTKILSVNMEGQNVAPGEYPIKIFGGYPGSNCLIDTTFYIHIYPAPAVNAHILDVDNAICHNEYVNAEVVNPSLNVLYTWSCTNCEADWFEGSKFIARYFNVASPDETGTDILAQLSLKGVDTTSSLGCFNAMTTQVTIGAGVASCPEGIDFFQPNGLSLVDFPARYFQWYERTADGGFNAIAGATDQTYFPPQQLSDCDPSQYIVASSFYPDKCWSTTMNCFENFGMRVCKEEQPKSNNQNVNFLLYPNPTKGYDVVMENISQDLKGNYHIELFDLRGKILMKQKVEIDRLMQIPVKLPEVNPGVYIFRISGNKFNEAFKLMIN